MLLYKNRNRVGGFFVTGVVLLLAIALVIFLTDFYMDGSIRGMWIFNDVVEEYDETIVDPKGKVEGIVGGVKESAGKANDKLISEGSKLDKKYNIVKDDNKVWVKDEKESVPESESNNFTVTDGEEEGKKDTGNKEDIKVDGLESMKEIKYNQVKEYVNINKLSDKDRKLLLGLSPFSSGEYEGDSIIVQNNSEGIKIYKKGVD